MPILHQYADVATWLGLIGSVVGFLITIITVLRSKGAAEQTQEAVADIKQKLSVRSAVFDLNRIAAECEELKVLHRIGAWEALPGRYTSLRRQLQALKTSPTLTDERRRTVLQSIIRQFNRVEQIVELALAAKQLPPDVAVLNKSVAMQVDKLSAILIDVQQAIGD